MIRLSNPNIIICSSNIPLVKFLPRRVEAKGHKEQRQQIHVDVSEESDSKPARKKTASRRVIKKKVTISAADNIILDPDVALELGKSIILTEASKEEAARKVHATHARIVTESILEPSRRRPSSIAIRDTPQVSKKYPLILFKSSRGSEESEYSKEEQSRDEEVDWIYSKEDDEKKDDADNDKSIDLEMTDDEENEDEFVQGEEQLNDDEDEEMTNAVVEESWNDDEEITDAAKANAKKTEEVKDDAKKAKLPPTSSSLSVSSGFGDQFLQLSSDTSLIVLTPIQETPSVAHVTTLPPLSISTIPPVPHQTTTSIPTPPITTDALTITIVVPESDALSDVQLRVAKLENDVSELKKIDHSAKAFATLKSQIPTAVDNYPGSKFGDTPTVDLEQEFDKSPFVIRKIKRKQAEKLKMLKYTIKSTDKTALKESLIEDENAMDKGVVDTVKSHKRQHDDDDDNDENLSARPHQGKKTKRKRKELDSSKKPSSPPKKPPKSTLRVKMWFVMMISHKTLQNPRLTTLRTKIGSNNLHGLLLLIRNGTSVKLYMINLNSLGHITVSADYFFNNDLEFLKTSDLEKTYTTSITKTKAALYEIKGIEDMVLTLWHTIKHAYDKDAEKGIKHWSERHKLWYISHVNKFSKHNVYSTQRILGVKSVSVKKLHGYGYLEEIMVKRADCQLYKFKEGDFVDLHLNDIKDMLLLAVQHKLFHLNDTDIVDFIVALRMFTRSLIIKIQVEDLQFGVESYQKKLNITAPQKTFLEIEFKKIYTPSCKPPGNTRFLSKIQRWDVKEKVDCYRKKEIEAYGRTY
uniref:Retrovirus-related Pol polyprotein from transposon TNT 1-94 n=1 Tax=Tanacetum cinerariifolium TaxID=118510 RepID=A0A6L2JRD0_TANCI|nr:hypothetical protein [Tanacetum cinerariifolium]